MKKIVPAFFVTAIFLAACKPEEVRVYSVPKEEAQAMPAANAEQPTAAASDATWTAPQSWKQAPAQPPRLATFLIESDKGKAEVSVTAFPGATGSDLDNVNRWRGQIGLPPIGENDLAGTLQKIDAGRNEFLVAEMENGGKAIRGAILHSSDKSWFFKMTGDAAAIAAQKEAFVEFLKSVRFGENAAPAAKEKSTNAPLEKTANAKTESTPVETKPAETKSAETTSAPKLSWKLPGGWQEQQAGGMRAASFAVAEGDKKADVSIIALGGMAGGTLANINRWRSQLSLGPISENDLASQTQKVTTPSGDAVIADIAGGNGLRILGAIFERGEKTWFVKMSGDDALVEKQKSAFLDFLKSLTLP